LVLKRNSLNNKTMKAFIKFNQSILRMPLQWQIWVKLLVTVNLIVPLFFINRLEAQVVVGNLFGSMILMTVLTGLSGFTRLVGLGHFLWFPLLYFLWTRLSYYPPETIYGIWIRVLMTLNAVSLVIDVIDVIRYLGGDRKETIQSLKSD